MVVPDGVFGDVVISIEFVALLCQIKKGWAKLPELSANRPGLSAKHTKQYEKSRAKWLQTQPLVSSAAQRFYRLVLARGVGFKHLRYFIMAFVGC